MKQKYVQETVVALALLASAAPGWTGEWGLGIGIAAQEPPQIDAERQVVVLPFPTYQGERLSFDFGSVSYAVAKSETFSFALEGQLRFAGYDPDESEALSGLEERDLTLDGGVSLASFQDWGVTSLKLMTDVLGVHNGYEISASYQYPIEFDRLTVVPGVSISWPSAELVEYYYGVRLDEATPERPAYSGDSVVNASVALSAGYELSDRWELIGAAQYTRLGDEITDSPIIAKDYEAIAYTAIVYRF